MKKVLILVIAAAIVGAVIARARKSGAEREGQADLLQVVGSPAAETSPSTPPPGLEAPGGVRAEPAEVASSSDRSAEATTPDPGHSPEVAGGHAAPVPKPPSDASEPEPAAEQTSQAQPEAPAAAAMLERARALVEEGKRLEARKLLTKVYLAGDPRLLRQALDALNEINSDLVFNPRCTEGARIHVVQRGENLITIGRKYGVSWRMIARVNQIERPELLRENQQIKILDGPTQILIDKSDFRLALFMGGDFIKQYRIGLGRDDITPTGTFVVDEMLVRPDWYPPWGGVIKYGEPGHLIGERWIGLEDQPGAAGLGIHGTDEPETIGTMCSNGCVRMHNEEVKELYDFITPGTTVRIVK